MNKNTMILLGLGAIALYLYEKSAGPANSQAGCAPGFTNVNGQCVQNPTTTTGDTSGTTGQFPCAPGYVSLMEGGVQTCVAAPGTDTDPIGTLLNQLI